MDRSISPKNNNNNYVAINTNDQETQNPFLPNNYSRFTHSSKTFPSELLAELLLIHKKYSYKQIKYVNIFFGIIGIISLIISGLLYVLPICKSSDSYCEINRWILSLTFIIIAGIAAVSGLIVYGILNCMIRCQLNGFPRNAGEDQLIIWQLTDLEWFHFLDYIYGPDREWHQDPCELSFCCRRKSYERLGKRNYGHIILHETGFIIDELYLVSFRTNALLRSEIVNVGNNPTRRFLRIHVLLTGGKQRSEIYFDLLAPSSIEDEQLQALVQYYTVKA